MGTDNWFNVDKQGLAKVVLRRGPAFILFELVQNCWDTNATYVNVTVTPVPGRPLVEVVVEDDDPDGFRDLTHAYTLYAESDKKVDPTKRGFLNLGEKLVLAICESAEISSTKGTVSFGPEGRSESRKRRDKGTVFKALLRLTRAQMDEMLKAAALLNPPIPTRINGELLSDVTVERKFEATLPTMIADEEGYMRPSRRKTVVRVLSMPGEPGRIFEMGIPVCETGDPWSVDVGQKVPLNSDRDNVTPAYLRELRVAVVNVIRDTIEAEAASSPAAAAALASPDIDPEAVKAIITAKYGDKVMVADIRDQEANHRAVAAGFTVLPGSAFASEQWVQIRKAEAIPVTTTQFATQPEPGSRQAKTVPPEKITKGMRRIEELAEEIAIQIISKNITVVFELEPHEPHAARYGSKVLSFNVGRLGYAWFDQKPASERVIDLIIHELAHELASNHLSDEYYEACTKLGARTVLLALNHPEIFADS